MKQQKTPTNNNCKEIIFKSLVKFNERHPNRVYLSNKITPDDLDFPLKYLGDDTEITYFEHEHPICSKCNRKMSLNGTKKFKPNKRENARLQQYICPECGAVVITSLKDHKKPNTNYTTSICEKALEYGLIECMSFEKMAELIENETGIDLNRQTVCYHQYCYCEEFLEKEERLINQMIKCLGIEPSGVYCYDEEFVEKKIDSQVRLTIIDAITNQIINDQVIDKEDFNPDFIEIFLKYSLKDLPKKLLITDGHPAYPSIIEKICIDHQLCIFHIIKNQRKPIFKKMNRNAKKEKRIENKIEENEKEIRKLQKQSQGKNGRKSKKDKKGRQIYDKKQKLIRENKELRKELRQIRKENKTLEYDNDRISHIYEGETEKDARRRFNTIYNQKEHLDEDIKKSLEKISKKFEKTITFYKNDIYPKTNNKIEGFFKITLPKHLKKRFRTTEGLKLKIRLNMIRWTWRNVLNIKHRNLEEIENFIQNSNIISC